MSDTGPATTLRHLIMGFQATHLVYVAAELGIAERLEDGPRGSAELAALVGADAGALHRVLRGLAHHGVLTHADDRFDLTPVDLLIQRSGLTAEEVSSILLVLELDGQVKSVPGGYVRIK